MTLLRRVEQIPLITHTAVKHGHAWQWTAALIVMRKLDDLVCHGRVVLVLGVAKDIDKRQGA